MPLPPRPDGPGSLEDLLRTGELHHTIFSLVASLSGPGSSSGYLSVSQEVTFILGKPEIHKQAYPCSK